MGPSERIVPNTPARTSSFRSPPRDERLKSVSPCGQADPAKKDVQMEKHCISFPQWGGEFPQQRSSRQATENHIRRHVVISPPRGQPEMSMTSTGVQAITMGLSNHHTSRLDSHPELIRVGNPMKHGVQRIVIPYQIHVCFPVHGRQHVSSSKSSQYV